MSWSSYFDREQARKDLARELVKLGFSYQKKACECDSSSDYSCRCTDPPKESTKLTRNGWHIYLYSWSSPVKFPKGANWVLSYGGDVKFSGRNFRPPEQVAQSIRDKITQVQERPLSDEPATSRQTWYLFILTKKDWRPKNLTKTRAGELIALAKESPEKALAIYDGKEAQG